MQFFLAKYVLKSLSTDLLFDLLFLKKKEFYFT